VILNGASTPRVVLKIIHSVANLCCLRFLDYAADGTALKRRPMSFDAS